MRRKLARLNRRSFLAILAAGLALDPERMLWLPGKKLISIPKPRLAYDVRTQKFLTTDIVIEAALKHCVMVYDATTCAAYRKHRIGDSIQIRPPVLNRAL
jgi:hypothetical protein